MANAPSTSDDLPSLAPERPDSADDARFALADEPATLPHATTVDDGGQARADTAKVRAPATISTGDVGEAPGESIVPVELTSMRTTLLAPAIPLAALVLLGTARARANGRFPAAQNLVVGPGLATPGRVLALQTTFGVLTSDDAGATWHWNCEASVGFAGEWDPVVQLTSSGRVVVALPQGLSVSDTGHCNFTIPASAPTDAVIDLAGDPNGALVVAAVAPPTGANYLVLSRDEGATWQRGWSTGGFISTVEVAPGNSQRVYVSGYTPSPATAPALYRSDDGGMTFALTTGSFQGGYAAYVAGVDPTRPDTVYLRSNLMAGGTLLLRSDDAGATTHVITQTTTRMTGFALSDDGRSIWVGGNGFGEGITRSTDRGATWQQAATGFTALCLRYQGGHLFACADEPTAGFAIGRSDDLGETFQPLLRFESLQGPEACPAASGVSTRCLSLWPGQQMMLAAAGGDAGVHDDATADFDAGRSTDADTGTLQIVLDAGATDGADGHTVTGGCSGCAIAPRRGGTERTLALAGVWAATVAFARRSSRLAKRARRVNPRANR